MIVVARLLLILPTGTYRAAEYLAAAEHLGVEVVIGSERAQALAATMGERFLELPLHDPGEAATRVVAHAGADHRLRLDGIVGVDDQALLTAALAAEELRLVHSPPAAVALTRDKAAMRAAFAAGHVPQPAYAVASRHPEAVAAAADGLGYPVVVKPCSLSGSRGVIRADSAAEAMAASRRVGAILEAEHEPGSAPLLVERFVPGREVAVEGILRRGEAEIITIFDKPDPLDGPYFEETLYVSPTDLSPASVEAVILATKRAVTALGLTQGPFHAELRLPQHRTGGDDGVLPAPAPEAGSPAVVLEVAARTIGGRCSKAMVMADGSSLEEVVILNALGLPHPPPRLASACGVLMIPIPATGTLSAVEGAEAVRSLPAITGLEITVPIGRHVAALPEGDRYLGFVFAAGEHRAEVEAALRAAEDRLQVAVEVLAPTDTVA